MLELFINASRISPLIAFVLNAILGSLVLYKNRSKAVNKTFFIFSLILSFWALACFFQSITAEVSTGLMWDQVLYTFAAFAPAVLMFLSFGFAELTVPRSIFWGGLSLSLFFIFLNFSAYFRGGVSFNFGARFVTIAGPGWFAYVAYYAVVVVSSLSLLFKRFKSSPEVNRNRLLYVLAAFVPLILAGNAYFVLIFFKISPLVDSLFNLLSSLGAVIYSVMISYLILKHDLLDFSLGITRSISYGLTGVFIGASVAVIYYIFKDVPKLQFASIISLVLMWAFYAQSLRQLIQTPLEEKWVSDWYDSDEVIAELSEALSNQFDRQEILGTVAHSIHQVIRIKDWILIVARPDENQNILRYDILFPEKNRAELSFTSPVIRYFDMFSDPIHFSRLESAVADTLKDDGLHSQSVFLPFYSPEALEGILIFGQKVSEARYSSRDIKLFRAIQSYVRAYLDRIRPDEKIRQEFEANRQQLFDLEKQLQRADRMEALTHTWSQCHHELRTPLSIIKLTMDTFDDDEDPEEMKQQVCKQLDRAGYIIDTMLRLSRDKETYEPHKEPVDLVEVIHEATGLYPNDELYSISVDLKLRSSISGIKDDLVAVFTNLITNARQAMPEGGLLKIQGQETGDKIVITVTDQGDGIPEAIRRKVWDPYFTSRKGQSRGLGLSLVFRIIRDHNGWIDFESATGQGTVFTIKFPVS